MFKAIKFDFYELHLIILAEFCSISFLFDLDPYTAEFETKSKFILICWYKFIKKCKRRFSF